MDKLGLANSFQNSGEKSSWNISRREIPDVSTHVETVACVQYTK